MDEKLTYCLTGATGFLGEHLVDKLLQNDDVQLRLLTRKNHTLYQAQSRVTVVQGDLLDKNSLEEFIVPGAVLINLAYLQSGSEANLIATRNLASICRQQSISRFLHLSSAVVAGRQNQNWITEESCPNPVNEYEKNKLAIEKILEQDLSEQIPLVVLRPTAIFGKGGKNGLKIISDFQKESHFIRRLKLTLLGNQQMHFVAVENVIAAILFLLYRPALSGYFIISDDDCINNNYHYIIQAFSQVMNLPLISPYPFQFIKKSLPLLLRLRHRTQIDPLQRYSCNKLKQAGFNKSIEFESALQNFFGNARACHQLYSTHMSLKRKIT
ncbi:MAG: NAD(P)-dependent oxidoreductase [Legionellales bacterium]|nr:NAD(P)-dependent oxidoreductase [Legionellales bacterium]